MSRFTFRRFLGHYFPFLLPSVLLAYIVLESYQMDFRPYYVAGKLLLLGRDLYLNPVTDLPQLYSPVNAAAYAYSGFIYPPFAAFFFAPFGALPYGTAKLLYSGLSLACLWGLLFTIVRYLQGRGQGLVAGGAIALVMCSFPVVAHFERGQFDLFVCYLTIVAFTIWREKGRTTLAALLLAIACSTKIFPAVALIYWAIQRQFRLVIKTLGAILVLLVAPIGYFGLTVYHNYLRRMFPGIFGQLVLTEPVNVHGQGVVNRVVQAIDGKGLLISHDFVHGYMNPFLRTPSLSFTIGLLVLLLLIYCARKRSIEYQFFGALNGIHLINPQTWIMGLVWYIPFFLYRFDRSNNWEKLVLALPLFLPPSTNANGMLAYAIVLGFAVLPESDG